MKNIIIRAVTAVFITTNLNAAVQNWFIQNKSSYDMQVEDLDKLSQINNLSKGTKTYITYKGTDKNEIDIVTNSYKITKRSLTIKFDSKANKIKYETSQKPGVWTDLAYQSTDKTIVVDVFQNGGFTVALSKS